jgi:multimeric flavodoxin WrbA
MKNMQILTLMGSPRKKGNTASVLDMVEQELSIRHRVQRLAITSVNINGCLGCKTCQKVTDRTGCVQKDDAASVFERIIAADAVIYSSPLYCWDFTAQMKALIDRHFCLVTGAGKVSHRSLIADKPTALLVTCGGPVEGNADVIQTVFERMGKFCKARVVNRTVVPLCTTPEALGEEARAAARKLAGDVNRALGQ